MEHKTLLILVMVVMIYSLICAAVMMVLEKRNEETSASDVLSTINTFLCKCTFENGLLKQI